MNPQIEKVLIDKFTPVLELWCNTYKLIGTHAETPRYSQITFNREGEDVILESTQKKLFYIPQLTKEEKEIITNAWLEDPTGLWQQWKEFRTKYLKENHKTISPY